MYSLEIKNAEQEKKYIQNVKPILRAHFYTGEPYMCDLRYKTPRVSSMARGVLRHCIPDKGLHPMRRERSHPIKAKDVTTFATPFACFTALQTMSEKGRAFSYLVSKGWSWRPAIAASRVSLSREKSACREWGFFIGSSCPKGTK